MQECLYVHPDNVRVARKELALRAAVIARPDWVLSQSQVRQLIVETERGVHTRCYVTRQGDVSYMIVYGRFNRKRGTSADIDFELTQEAVSMLGIPTIVGTFSVGSVRGDDRAGRIYIPHDMIGYGNFNRTRNRQSGFRNVDMLLPFCPRTRAVLVKAASACEFAVEMRGVYASFHGYPRYETLAELEMYGRQGVDVVGQTLDVEATLAREAGCHYAAVVATIDDHEIRSRFLANDKTASVEIDRHILNGRRRTFEVFLSALPGLAADEYVSCNCVRQGERAKERNDLFYYRPAHLCEDES
ncbi:MULTISPECIES: hypothetical protein [unclassified Bradyrhizobium]|uniref:phosphorylase family protein n=2 Tax=Bradyrhizobium TaxID=374 RepID=UPI0029167AB0|nr:MULTISPECIES: hypothetical protein [unclassified Bradyrhizobium]